MPCPRPCLYLILLPLLTFTHCGGDVEEATSDALPIARDAEAQRDSEAESPRPNQEPRPEQESADASNDAQQRVEDAEVAGEATDVNASDATERALEDTGEADTGPPALEDVPHSADVDLSDAPTESGDLHEAADTESTSADDSSAGEMPDVDAPTCLSENITFSQDNPDQYEFYELCVAVEGASEETLNAIDETLYCGVSGIFADCKAGTELGCHGDLIYAEPGSKTLSELGWSTLCALSLQDGVRIIAGGYWL